MTKKLTDSERAAALHDIQQAIGLRRPLRESLDALDRACRTAGLADPKRPFDPESSRTGLKGLFPGTFRDFAHDFPSLAYSIATGVGKTRLMAAFLVYLYRTHGILNFFILAPNLTIYLKLIRDFGDTAYEKYVFRGVSEFVNNRPVVITADNYAQQGALFQQSEVRINIFNIAKFNTDSKTSKKDGKTGSGCKK
jgi:type III restriction enzyme